MSNMLAVFALSVLCMFFWVRISALDDPLGCVVMLMIAVAFVFTIVAAILIYSLWSQMPHYQISLAFIAGAIIGTKLALGANRGDAKQER